MTPDKEHTNQWGFTLIELLVVIAVLATLATAVTLIINPAELVKQARDSTRLSDLRNLDSALSIHLVDTEGSASTGSSSVVYVSLPDSNSDCSSYSLPSLPSGWSYSCVTEANLQNVDSTGWIPIDFTNLSISSPLATFPIDPTNSASDGLYYTYIVGSYHIEAPMESRRQQTEKGLIVTKTSTNDIDVPGSVRGRACGDNGTFTDSRDDTEYSLTLIGEGDNQQCWFAENLDYDNGCTNVTWVNDSDEGWCGYHSSDTGDANGLLYQWSAAMNDSTIEGAQGLCPSGWHVPTDGEFKTMEKSLGMSQSDADSAGWRGNNEGAELKQSGTSNWNSEECGSTSCNFTGFDAVANGYRDDGSSFWHFGNWAHFYTSSDSGNNAFRRSLHAGRSDIARLDRTKAYAFSVRCLKD